MGILQGGVALVTGAASGIGRASAQAFAREGARAVVVSDIDADGGEETVYSFENLVQFGERSRDKVSLGDFAVRDLAAEQREAQKQTQLRAAIEREREAAAERKAERERNADMAFYIERELRDWGVRTISRDDILKIMPEVRAAASKIAYGSQTEIMAKIVQEKLAPKQSRGMRR